MIDGRKIHFLNIGQPYGEIKVELHKKDSSLVREFTFPLQYVNISDIKTVPVHYDGGIVGQSCE
jgi:hypothetical protein